MKRVVLVVLMVLLALGGVYAGGQQESGTTKIGVAIPSADHGWTGGIVWWANKRAAEIEEMYDDIEVSVVTADGPSTQIQAVENLMATGIDFLVILPHESAPLTPIVKEAHDAGTKIIVVDRGLTENDFGFVNLAGDNPGFGTESGKWFVEQMLEKSNGGTFVAMGGLPVPIDTERMDGFFAEIAKESSITNLLGGDKYEFADWSTQKGLELMETFLSQYDHIDGVFCQDDDVLRGVLQAYAESGRSDIHTFLGGAGSKVVMKQIMDGDPLVRATVTYHPSMIADGIDYAVDVATGKKSDDFHTASAPIGVVIPSVLLTADNVAGYYEADSVY